MIKTGQWVDNPISKEALELIGYYDKYDKDGKDEKNNKDRKPTDKVFPGFNDSMTNKPLKNWLEAERLAKENITKKQTEIAILDDRRFIIEQQTEDAEKRKENAEKEANLAELFKDLAGVAEINWFIRKQE